MNYEVEQALREKVDKHELWRVTSELESVKRENQRFEERLGRQENTISTLQDVLRRLMEALADDVDHHSVEVDNTLLNLRGYI